MDFAVGYQEADFRAIYEAILARTGKSERIALGRVSRLEFERFAIAADYLDPIHFDDEQARARGYPAAVAPAMFLSSIIGWGSGPPQEALRADGTIGSEVGRLPVGELRLMGGGQELEFHADLTDGTEVTLELAVEGAELKRGKSGDLILIAIGKRYFDGTGRLLVTCREKVIAR